MRIAFACVALALAQGSALAQEQASSDAAGCAYDEAAFLEQSVDAFDQSDEGFRSLATQGCYSEAGDLIEAYLSRHAESVDPDQLWDLTWHAGQMRAYAEDYPAALEHFRKTRPADESNLTELYKVDAVIAFLERDREKLLATRDALAAVPEPPGFQTAAEAAVAEARLRFPNATPPTWPLGLDTVDDYIRCFDHPYAIAYEGLCK